MSVGSKDAPSLLKSRSLQVVPATGKTTRAGPVLEKTVVPR